MMGAEPLYPCEPGDDLADDLEPQGVGELPAGYEAVTAPVPALDPVARVLSGRRRLEGGVKLTEPRAMRWDAELFAEIVYAAADWSLDASSLMRAALAEGWPILLEKLRRSA